MLARSLTSFVLKDMQTRQLSTMGTMYLSWVDEHLQWSGSICDCISNFSNERCRNYRAPSNYGGLEELTVGAGEIWKPDIRSFHGVSMAGMDKTVNDEPIRLASNGTAVWWVRTTFKGTRHDAFTFNDI